MIFEKWFSKVNLFPTLWLKKRKKDEGWLGNANRITRPRIQTIRKQQDGFVRSFVFVRSSFVFHPFLVSHHTFPFLSLFSLLLLLFLMVIKTVSFPITFRYHFYFVLIFSSLPFSLSFLFSLLSLSLFVDSFFVLLSPLLSLRWT
jgi:hypothetical protein